MSRHQGFTTEFLRPQAVTQIRDFRVANGGPHDLFPAALYPAGTPKTLPDTYNAPGFPYLLAGWFFLTHPEFAETPNAIADAHMYAPDRWIPLLNQGFLLLTSILVFALGRRLFDDRVAWMALVAFLGTDLIWQFTLTALSTSFLMFVVTGALICALEIVCVGEACAADEDNSFGPAWVWTFIVAILLSVACLTRLHLLVLLVPLFALLLWMPRGSVLLSIAVSVVVLCVVSPWFFHLDKVSGNFFGSNFTLLLYGQGDYSGNQIYCATAIPSYEHIFKNAGSKEFDGFRWHMDHAWSLLGSNVMIIFFGASILHPFKRKRTQLFHWFLFIAALLLIVANNLGEDSPDPVSSWNALVLLFPCMVVFGCAFFFILLDRLALQMRLLHNMIVGVALVLTLVPLAMTLSSPKNAVYAFPPYMPPLIKAFGQCANPDEWVTTDMPWATAWYADRPSLWLPDSISDFETLHDNVCPTGILILTPVSWAEPLTTFTHGEYKDWLPFVTPGGSLPSNFPLSSTYTTQAGGPDYSVWSDRPRWAGH